MKKTICLDFDGVIHSYTSGWKGVSNIPDSPVPGALEFILGAFAKGFEVAIYSARSSAWRGRIAMKKWLRHHTAEYVLKGNIRYSQLDSINYSYSMEPPDHEADAVGRALVKRIKWPKYKPPAHITIDDRALTFTGEWPSFESIDSFKPWTT